MINFKNVVVSSISFYFLNFLKTRFFSIIFCFFNLFFIEYTFSENNLDQQYFDYRNHTKNFIIPDYQIEIENLKLAFHYIIDLQTESSGFSTSLTPEKTQYFQEKVQFHKIKAEECFNKAQEKCWYLPDISYKEMSASCFTTALAILSPADPKAKVAIAVLTLLNNYGLSCIEEWNEIQSLLHEADYHYEMSLFYQEVLDYHK